MQRSIDRILAISVFALVSMAAVAAPAATALHTLDHVESDASTDAPEGEAACDLCEALANGRVAIEAAATCLPLGLALVERLDPAPTEPIRTAAPVTCASPRAPPLG